MKTMQSGHLLLTPPKVSLRDQEAGWWAAIRSLLAALSIMVWMLMILLPGMDEISNLDLMARHLPHVVIGLGLVGAIMAAYSLRSDGHLVWFTITLLILAGWM